MSAAVEPVVRPTADPRAKQKRRAWWLKQLHAWHWISAAVSLVGMILFAATGITLNHAADIPATPVVTRATATLPADLHAELQRIARELAAAESDTAPPLPAAAAAFVEAALGVAVSGRSAEWSDDAVYVSLPRPGGDAWVNVDLATGEAESEITRRGAISTLNDLHKGRHAGTAWRLFLDVFSVACLVFSLTGLWLLHLHSKGRRLTWPLVGLGLLVPVAVAVLALH